MLGNVTETDKAYLAGFVDGEGCLVVSRFKNPSGSPSYRSMLIVTQCVGAPLRALRNLWGVGHIRCTENTGLGNRPKYVWNVYSRQASDVLSEIIPHLKIKKTQAEGIVELQKHIDEHRGNKVLTPEILEYREWIKNRISDLNQGRLVYDA